MIILQIMGCTSDQYGSMERYLVRKAKCCSERGDKFFVAYENLPSSGEFIGDFLSAGGHFYQLKCSSLFDFAFYRKLLSALKNNNINVVHGYFTPTCHYVMIASFLFGVRKRFRTAANLPYTLFKIHKKSFRLSESIFKIKHRVLSAFPMKIICRSESVKEEFMQMEVKREKITVASGGIDTEVYKRHNKSKAELRKMFHLHPGKKIIGTACRLVPIKRIDLLIRAASRLVAKRNDLLFLIIGDGPEYSNLNNLVNEENLAQHIKMLGHCHNISKLLNVLDLFVLSSFSEGTSNSILEAMACELPVIVSNIPPNREIFGKALEGNSYIGETFESGNDADLACKIEALLERRDLNEIGKQARKVVNDHFSLSARIEKELCIYESNA